jgi:hypothetical protein
MVNVNFVVAAWIDSILFRVVLVHVVIDNIKIKDAYLLGYYAFLGASLTDLGNRHGTIARNNDLMIGRSR